jgi:hypothetical protein
MGRFKIVGLVVALVLAAGAMSASAATAKQTLVLREGGLHEYLGMDAALAKNAPVEAIFTVPLGECAAHAPSYGLNNASTKDPIAFEARVWNGSCQGEYEGNRDQLEAVVTGITLMRNGTAKLSDAQLGIHVWSAEYAEGCQYYFKLHTATFKVPSLGTAGEAVLTATAKPFGERALKPVCRTKPAPGVTITLADNGGYPLETTLEGV